LEIRKLTWNTISGNRKSGFISLLINIDNGKMYLVPEIDNSIIEAKTILKKKEDFLEKYPQIASNLVPAMIEVKNNKIVGILIGYNGSLEEKYHVKHTKKQLDKAHDLVLLFIYNGDIPLSDPYLDKVA